MSKKVRGSGGYIIADLTEEEEKKILGGEYFIGALGRLDETRISSYHCNNCNKDFESAPMIRSERLDKSIENVTLIEEGEYICRECNSLIGSYKIFADKVDEKRVAISNEPKNEIPLSRFIGMKVYDDKARDVGVVDDICISNNRLILKIKIDGSVRDIIWEKIIAIQDIVLVKSQSNVCSNCNHVNKEGSKFCEECGNIL